MKTKKECETLKETYETSRILQELFEKYKNYDSTLNEHYDPNTIFKNRINRIENIEAENNSVAIIEYKESIFRRIADKIKQLLRI